jgi:deazaflavin-dependent oxidoreductase (nitroreductase family)
MLNAMPVPPTLVTASCLPAAFRALNAVAEPLIRAGFGAPWLWPTGLVVLETTGRVSGRPLSVPLLATRLGDLVVASTVRRDSHWVRNLASQPRARVWLCGRPHDAVATVLVAGQPAPAPDAVPEAARALVALLAPWTEALGVAFAVLATSDRS